MPSQVNNELRENVLRAYAKLASRDDDLLHRGRVEDDFEQVVPDHMAALPQAQRLAELTSEETGFCLGWLNAHRHVTDRGLKLLLEDEGQGRGRGIAGG